MDPQKNILVCVTQQKTCERLIHKAVSIKEEFKVTGDLYVIHVAKNGLNFLDNPKEGEALQYLFEISKSVGANLFVLKSDNIIKCIADFVQENNIGCVVIGKSPESEAENEFNKRLRSALKDHVDIKVIP